MPVHPQVGYGHGHGQTSYPDPSYSQPQHNGYYQPPPPAPYYQQLDPNTFRRDYQNRLAELTVNSRPIIQNLSMVAQEYSRFSEIVAQCLEAHLGRVSASVGGHIVLSGRDCICSVALETATVQPTLRAVRE